MLIANAEHVKSTLNVCREIAEQSLDIVFARLADGTQFNSLKIVGERGV